MEPITQYVRERIEALTLLGYYSHVAAEYIPHLLRMEYLLSSDSAASDRDPRARRLELQYPIDWVLIRRELETIVADRDRCLAHKLTSRSNRNARSTSEILDPTADSVSEQPLSVMNGPADDGRIQISVSLEYGRRKGWFSSWEWESASFSDIEGTTVYVAMKAVQYYMRACGYELAPRPFTLVVQSSPELSGTTIYERTWIN